MKKILVSLLAAPLLTATAAFAQPYTYEGFSTDDFTADTTVDNSGGGFGWAGNWSVDASANANNVNRYWASTYSLDYTDSQGNSLATNPGTLELRAAGSGQGPLSRDFAAPADGELWFSFLNIRTSTHTWGYDLQFLDAAGGIQFRIQNDGSGNFRLGQAGGAMASIDIVNHTTDEFPQGQLFVGQVTNAGSGAADSTINVWVNPENMRDLQQGAAATATLTDREVAAISQFNFVKGANHTGYFDELRVGNSADAVMVIPEPATYAIWLGALALGAIAWRRRISRCRSV